MAEVSTATEQLKGTGIRLFLVSELPCFASDRARPTTPEERAERVAEERGELIFVAGGGFADCAYKGRTYRFWGDFVAERPIRIDCDPTSDLIAVVREWAEDRLLNLQGDLLHGGDTELTRWDIFAAPFTVELSEKLRARLEGTWKRHEPQRLPGETEPYPLPPQFAQGVPATVEQWHEDEGWGIVTSDKVPEPMRFDSSAIETEGDRTLVRGQPVEVDVEGPLDEDEFPYRAWRVVPT